MNRAAFGNEDPSRLGFDSTWAAYQRRLQDNPLTGWALNCSAGCRSRAAPPGQDNSRCARRRRGPQEAEATTPNAISGTVAACR